VLTLIVALLYGGAIFIAITQNVFSNKLIQGIQANVPGLDPNTVINSGATGLQIQILGVFMISLKDAFIAPIALNGVAFFLALLSDKNMMNKGTKMTAART
jgi:hypothetical protein